jgi:hypothetical protein
VRQRTEDGCRLAHDRGRIRAQDIDMSKGKHGNKEAKKPKKAQLPAGTPGAALPAPVPAAPDRLKKR